MKPTGVPVFFAFLALSAPSFAEELPPEAGAPRTVAMFDLFCHRQLPDLDVIASIAAAGGFTELVGDELQFYQPPVPAEELHAWRFHDLGSDFVLSTARSLPDDLFKQQVPAFADSVNYGCSLVVPMNADGASDMFDEMVRLMTREPDEIWDQPPLRAHSWCGQNETLLTCTYYWAPQPGHEIGLLAANVFMKN